MLSLIAHDCILSLLSHDCMLSLIAHDCMLSVSPKQMIARGKNASELFPAVVKNVACKNIEVSSEKSV